jgi:hypothetical protein
VLPEVYPVLLRNLYRFRKQFVVPGLHRLLRLHSEILALLLPLFVFRDNVAHGRDLTWYAIRERLDEPKCVSKTSGSPS